MMIIGIDASRAVTPQRTGTEAYARFLIQALAPLAAGKGHHLRLYFNQPPPPHLLPTASHVEVVVMPWPRLWTHVRLAWELQRRPPHVYFTPAHVIPLTYSGGSVATVHDLGYHYFPEAHPWRQLLYLRWSTRHNGRRGRRVIADSQATKADLVRFDAIEPDKIEVVYPGVDPDLKPVTDAGRLAAVQQRYGIKPPYLLYLGTLQPRKNLVRLVEAYAGVAANAGVRHQLVLAGKAGWLAQPILEAIDTYQVPIIKTGFVDEADKAALISGATALLYPSLYEGFGFPVLEGQACGTAVLCANGSSLPEIAGDGALLVDPLDTQALAAGIQRLVEDAVLRQALIAQGFSNVARFSWAKAAQQVLAVLEAAADEEADKRIAD